jgi:hypothetical protein
LRLAELKIVHLKLILGEHRSARAIGSHYNQRPEGVFFAIEFRDTQFNAIDRRNYNNHRQELNSAIPEGQSKPFCTDCTR